MNPVLRLTNILRGDVISTFEKFYRDNDLVSILQHSQDYLETSEFKWLKSHSNLDEEETSVESMNQQNKLENDKHDSKIENDSILLEDEPTLELYKSIKQSMKSSKILSQFKKQLSFSKDSVEKDNLDNLYLKQRVKFAKIMNLDNEKLFHRLIDIVLSRLIKKRNNKIIDKYDNSNQKQLFLLDEIEILRRELSLSLGKSYDQRDIKELVFVVEEFCEFCANNLKPKYKMKWLKKDISIENVVYGQEINFEPLNFIYTDVLVIMTTPINEQLELNDFSIEESINNSHNITWLEKECSKLFHNSDRGKDTAKIILNLLKEKKKDEIAIQSGLFDILGEEGFELMAEILTNVDELISPINKVNHHIGGNVSKTNETVNNHELRQEINLRQRKILSLKSNKKHSNDAKIREETILLNKLLEMQKNQQPVDLSNKQHSVLSVLKYFDPDMYESSKKESVEDSAVEFIQGNGFEEVILPPPKQLDENTFQKIPISNFPNWAQLGFKGFTHLNRVQSIVYNAAFNTDENILVCAPTGCGKTNIAMMTILREVGKRFENGILRKDFKIVYVAPMKALAAEMTSGFRKRLAPLGLIVKEYTGDMQLTKKEVEQTQVIVTTPEKWDIITRKATDQYLIQSTKLIILDEVHILNEDRGPVIEILVARTFRQIELSQSMVRIVGLSATLPNYMDVAVLLRVNIDRGLFFFNEKYRPVPLTQHFIGVSGDRIKVNESYDEICSNKVIESLEKGHQVMIFVHSRKGTVKTAKTLCDLINAKKNEFFKSNGILTQSGLDPNTVSKYRKLVKDSSDKELKELFQFGMGVHHAGMLRQDRNLVEELFSKGIIKILCCTSTLAWGVNLPAHTVIIKGTEVYDTNAGKIKNIGMLDVMQIFGRAGRPQFDSSGEAFILTSIRELPKYLAMVARAKPIESQLQQDLENHLNAEICLGTVSNIREGIRWLTHTYLYIRMQKDPIIYGVTYDELFDDPTLGIKRRELIIKAVKNLDAARMVRYSESTGILVPTDLGRIASHYYIHFETIKLWNEKFIEGMDESSILGLLSSSKEFDNIQARDDEEDEIIALKSNAAICPVGIFNADDKKAKVNVLLQAYISQYRLKNFSLTSDLNYISQNAGRVVRAMFEIALKRKCVSLCDQLLLLGKCIEKRMWAFQTPLRQFQLPREILDKIEEKDLSPYRIKQTSVPVLNQILKAGNYGNQILNYVNSLPELEISCKVQPVTKTVLRVQVTINPAFNWISKYHGEIQSFWLFVEDLNNDLLYYSESFVLRKDDNNEQKKIEFMIPVSGEMPGKLYIRVIPENWVGVESETSVNLNDIVFPPGFPPNTPLFNLNPLSITVLKNPAYESLYNFKYFNPVQTQVFHTLYYTDNNILIGAPTSSGKTIIAEIACMRQWNVNPTQKIIYIAPLKALVRERVNSWKKRFVDTLGKKLVELTGEYTPDIKALQEADIVITTPEKWDGISRNWQSRSYVKKVGLVIMDEIHMLGQERGAILEVIVSRMRHISWSTGESIRLLGLSTTLANSHDLADWLGISPTGQGLFNFPQTVRPVQLRVHVQGFSGKHYCPRMNSMNKPCYNAILNYAGSRPTLIFVSSRRQTRLTAFDLISLCVTDENPYRFVKMTDEEMTNTLMKVKDSHLKHVIQYGVGIHHAGLTNEDKTIVEDLFLNLKIQILVCTSTLAWGVNLPASLVIVKGTEYFEAKEKAYVDYSLVDVLQMMGRAGRPQFDTSGEAVIMCREERKDFYSMMLYEPFPVESCLLNNIHDHFNAEIVSGTIKSFKDAVDYLNWTFLFRRLINNPSYYGVKDASFESLIKFLSSFVEDVIEELEMKGCVKVVEEKGEYAIYPTKLGRIASYYYLNYKSPNAFSIGVDSMENKSSIQNLLKLICEAKEFSELPVRHNEDKLNEQLADVVPWGSYSKEFDSPHVKTYLLLQAHFSHIEFPISDYITDLKSVLDQMMRVCQAFIDISAEKKLLDVTLNIITILQMVMQSQWFNESSLKILPFVNDKIISQLERKGIENISSLIHKNEKELQSILSSIFKDNSIQAKKIVEMLPIVNVEVTKYDEEIIIELRNLRPKNKFAYLPKFPKQKDEGWFLILTSNNKIHSLKRIKLVKDVETIQFPTPNASKINIHLLSDCYIGLDQQINI